MGPQNRQKHQVCGFCKLIDLKVFDCILNYMDCSSLLISFLQLPFPRLFLSACSLITRMSYIFSPSIFHSTISSHKKQVNCVQWNANGNWLASGSMDGLIKLYDIRTMKELEVWRGQNSEVSAHLSGMLNLYFITVRLDCVARYITRASFHN